MIETGSTRAQVILVNCELKRPFKKTMSNETLLSPEESLDELASLTTAAHARVVGRLIQQRSHYDPAFLIGKGKVNLLKGFLEKYHADTVIFDGTLSPAQQRNIELAVDCKVLDRTQLILDIFAQRARTREGKLQVELAQLNYLLPRLAGRGVYLSRLGGGIGTRGPGETKLETDQRKIHHRIHKIKQALQRVRAHRHLHRSSRKSVPIPIVSLVGYTNAGKSTLFNALTRATTLSSQQLFATLDPLLRRVRLPSKREILLSDTVGFVSKLPATLISAFRATLEEIGEAQLLLHVIDSLSFQVEQQKASVLKVLEELDATTKPLLEVYNKSDLLHQSLHPSPGTNAVVVSALKNKGIPTLLEKIDEAITNDPLVQARFLLESHRGDLLSQLYSKGKLIHQEYRNSQVLVEVEAPYSLVEKLKDFRI